MEKSDQSVETSDDQPIMPENSENSTSKDIEDEQDNSTLDMLFVLLFVLFCFFIPYEPLDLVTLAVSSLLSALLDALFLYVPLINEDIKCVMVDNRLKIAALVFRSFSDLRYLVRIIFRIKNGWRKSQSLKKIAMSIAVDTVCLLPIPQVVVLIFLPKMKGSSSLKIMKLLNSLILLQYLTRVYPFYVFCKEHNNDEHEKKIPNRLDLKGFKILLNLIGFLLASHVLGAFWYFFSIQREIDCWAYAGRIEKGSKFSTSCDENTFRNVTLIHNSCPINPPDPSIFDFGIFLYALQSGMQGSTNFPQKCFQCFSWGLRNLSSFGSNLNTSTYGWENLFVAIISISGLVLFMYLLGHVQTFMQGTNRSNSLRQKMKTIIEPKIECMLSEYGLPKEMKSKIKRIVEGKLEEDEDLIVENMFSVLSVSVSGVEAKDLAMEIKCRLFMDKLNKVDGLKYKGDEVLKKICEHLEPVFYSEGSYIIREGEPVDMMFFITLGSVLTYATNNGGSNGSSSTIQLEKEKDGLYGEELLTWAEGPSSKLSNLPISPITVKSHKKVEIFALKATDLQSHFNTDGTLTIAVDHQIVK